ncbi:MAG: hypothetical protein R2752_19705 [Vicinamibacterales bacterium]
MSLWKRVYVERRAVVLPLIALLVANVAALALGVFPLRQSVANAQDEAYRATTGLEAARRDNQSARTARVRKDEADVELTKFYTDVLPKSPAEASYLTHLWLQLRARRYNLDFQTGLYKVEPLRESRLSKASGNVLLRGTYADIRRFLYDVETAQEFIVVEKVELGESGSLQDSAGGIVAVTLDVATYFVTPGGGGEK